MTPPYEGVWFNYAKQQFISRKNRRCGIPQRRKTNYMVLVHSVMSKPGTIQIISYSKIFEGVRMFWGPT